MGIHYPLVEKFISINGEGPKAGMLAAFIRLKGCNLQCNYCDTTWANVADCPCEETSAEELISWLKQEKISRVTLTGGEPLLTPDVDQLIENLGQAGALIEIETNGSIDLKPFDKLVHRPAFTMDYKCPGSGMESRMKTGNFSLLRKQDTVKFVVSDIRDLHCAYEITREYRLTDRCKVYLSPVFGRIDPKDIVTFMQEHHWNDVHLQLQLHKFIWDPAERGV